MPKAKTTDRIQSAPGDADIFTGALIVRIAALEPQRVIAATVTPFNLGMDDAELIAMVGWEGIDTMNSSVAIDVEPGDPEQSAPWLRFLQLLWAVFGPETLPEPEVFGPGRWSSIVLSTQELDGELQHSVLVVVDRVRESAWLIRSDPTRQSDAVLVPAELLVMDAGAVLTEMASRLILGRPWL
jgi:hypothetical protein